MKFGETYPANALGAVLAHSVKVREGSLRKGAVLGESEIAQLANAGVTSIMIARLEPGDVAEDVAATRVATALAGIGTRASAATTGRVNLHAAHDGLLSLDVMRIEAANLVHEGITMATLPADCVVTRGQMLATIKIIPYAVPAAAIDEVLQCFAVSAAALQVNAWRGIEVGLVLTRTAETRDSVLDKMHRSVEQRLEPMGARLVAQATVKHAESDVATALMALQAGRIRPLDLLLVSGAAATVDRGDVVPAAVVRAGGSILHAGMPVDPGNLLVLAQMPVAGQVCPVVGIPTCARSPKLNGFDFVLRRFAAGLPVGSREIMKMGVGGLLTEIRGRPMPRDAER